MMYNFLIFSVLLAVNSARSIALYAASPELHAVPYIYGVHSSSLVTPTQQQFHAQDELGQYSYGYAEPHSAKQEVRSLDGVTRGSYSYRDADGKLQTVDYTGDANGFRVSATNLPRSQSAAHETPVPDTDTSAVTADSNVHLADHQADKLRVPVQDTVEVAAAKIEHFKRWEQEKLRNTASRPSAFAYHTLIPLIYQSGYQSYSHNQPINSRFLATNYFY